MLSVNEFVKDLIEDGFTRKEAFAEAHKEIEKRNKNVLEDIKCINDNFSYSVGKFDQYKR